MVLLWHEYSFLYDIARFLVVIFFTAIIAKISRALVARAMKSTSPYLASRIKNYVFVVIWVIGIILAIRQLGASTDVLMLLVALGGIGFIVSAWHVIQNIVSRSFLSLEMQYKAGDIISIKNFSGKVVEITDLNTVLLDDDGNLISVPNVLFLKEIWKKHVMHGYEITIPIEIKKEIDTVSFEKELINSIKKLKKYFKKEPNVVTSKTDEKTIELSLILNLKHPEKKGIVTMEINEIVSKLIAEFEKKAEDAKKEKELKELKDINEQRD